MKRSSFFASAFIGLLVSLGLLFSAPLASAVTITVNNGTDTPTAGTVTLRQAVGAAVDGDQIVFNLPAGTTINLSQGRMIVRYAVTITGPGANVLTVQGDGQDYIFAFSGFLSSTASAHISGFSIAGGGGAILNETFIVTLTGCTIANNVGSGGIVNDFDLTLINSTVSDNSSTREMVVSGLTPGQMYNFQVRAMGGSTGQSDWSDAVSHMSL
ncbi:MAG: fibronectin type III domain-containing protein [Chthoniobacterales bacterium]